jgi:hypothetical protein
MSADEWTAHHFPPVVAMNDLQHREALTRLEDVPDLLGHLPAEIVHLLRTLIARRDGAALVILAQLRHIDGEAKA